MICVLWMCICAMPSVARRTKELSAGKLLVPSEREEGDSLATDVLTDVSCLVDGSPSRPDSLSVDSLRKDWLRKSRTLHISTCYSDMLNNDHPLRRKPWVAAAQIAIVNVGLLAFDRYVLQEPFAHVTTETVWRNVRFKALFWDRDNLPTNYYYHPYHGSIYYNAARSNGMNVWQSAALSIGGNLMWEIAGEMEPISYNDLISTSFGGIVFGEITHRLSDIILDETTEGFERVVREVAGGAVNPMRGVNRLLQGRSWKSCPRQMKVIPPRFKVSLKMGWRHIDVRSRHFGENPGTQLPATLPASGLSQVPPGNRAAVGEATHDSPFIDLDVDYGDPVTTHSCTHPYDFFRFSMSVTPAKGQPIVSRFNIMGRISSVALSKKGWRWEGGLYQHFNYLNSESMTNGVSPYRFVEAASIGLGTVGEIGSASTVLYRQDCHISGMMLGAIITDYPENLLEKTYSNGSGFTCRWHSLLSIRNSLNVAFSAEYYRYFVWKDYSEINLSAEPGTWSAQGDAGVTGLWQVSLGVDARLYRRLGLSFTGRYFGRHSRYDHHSDIHSRTWDVRLGLLYTLGK